MEDFIPTRVSKLRNDATKNFVTVNYEAPKKKSTTTARKDEDKINIQNSKGRSISAEQEKDIDPKKQQELEMKRIRYEVMKFGMSGFEKVQARKAKVALAISLGAQPPKNRKVNYKMLKKKKLKQKEMEKRSERVSGLDRSMIKPKTKKIRKKDSGGILGVYGKVNKVSVNKKKS